MDVMQWLEARDHEEPWHNQRYALSVEWLEPIITPGAKVLEVGGGTVFRELLKTKFPGATFEWTDIDIRYDFPIDSESFDVAVCMEVIEHIQDRDPTNDYERAAFTGSGIYNMLFQIHRVLRPNGRLFLTTPNVCGWHNLFRMCELDHPFFYDLHHRELSPTCVRSFLENSGFSIERLETTVVWNNHDTPKSFIDNVTKFLVSHNFKTDFRGDDIFVIARLVELQ